MLQALTLLEEVTYFDEAKLIAVDHPIGTEVWPNEMMAINAPPPEFEVFCFRNPINPLRATDHRGVDVTDHLAARRSPIRWSHEARRTVHGSGRTTFR